MMPTSRRWRRVALLVAGLLGLALLVRSCRDDGTAPPVAKPVSIEDDDIAVVRRDLIRASVRISGELEAETEATIRAEVAGTVRAANADAGQPVSRGALLARIDDPALPAARRSAEIAVSAAQTALRNARRDVERYTTLVRAGAAPRRDLENAYTTLAAAQAQLATARAQLTEVRTDEAATTVQAPIAGIVSAKTASSGDVVQVGDELYRVIDPRTMKLEAQVPAEALLGLAVGAGVDFTVRGYPWRFRGTVERIHPSADPATRQVPIQVTVPNLGRRLVQGLFAEGTVTLAAREGLAVPVAAVREEPRGARAKRVRAGVVEEVAVQVGLEDQVQRIVEVRSGLALGDTVLVGPVTELAPGTRVRIERPVRDTAGSDSREP